MAETEKKCEWDTRKKTKNEALQKPISENPDKMRRYDGEPEAEMREIRLEGPGGEGMRMGAGVRVRNERPDDCRPMVRVQRRG